jgi:hypothetical protein
VNPKPDDAPEREAVTPEVVDDAAAADGPDGEGDGEQVTRPTKLIRIASMVRAMLDEVRQAPLDDAGRRRLRDIHQKSINELESVLSPELQKELEEVVLPLVSDPPSDSELRLAQAQLVGWLEGLFHGIQATLFTQQAQAQGQLEEVRRRRMLEAAGAAQPGGPQPGGAQAPSGYL